MEVVVVVVLRLGASGREISRGAQDLPEVVGIVVVGIVVVVVVEAISVVIVAVVVGVSRS